MQKVDLFVKGPQLPLATDAVLYGHCPEVNLPLYLDLSLRTDCTASPDDVDLDLLKKSGLFDVFLCPANPEAPLLGDWFDACRAREVPVRVQFQAPFDAALDANALADRLAAAGVPVVNLILSDPFTPGRPCRDEQESLATVDAMNALATAVDARGIEANIYGLPLCLVSEDNLALAGNTMRFFLDHQQYKRAAHELATALYPRAPFMVEKLIPMLLLRHTCFDNPVDKKLLDWLLKKHRRLYVWTLAFHKLARHLHLAAINAPKAIDNSVEAHLAEIERLRAKHQHALGPTCSQCSLHRICDRETAEFTRMLPGLAVSARDGDPVVSPHAFAANQHKHYDAIDELRRGLPPLKEALAKEANDLVTNVPAPRELDMKCYYAENTAFTGMPGAVRWYSVTNSEKISTVLVTVAAPFTLAVTFGGGLAEQIGFSIGRHIKLVCPMIATTHRLVLHVDEDGHYVLLRDGIPIEPTEFEGQYYTPVRLPTVVEPRLSAWNIDESICMQNLVLWEGKRTLTGPEKVKFSVITVCTRYSRRLEASLRCLAHQQGLDPGEIEAIVGYVPGLDATDDVINSVRAAYPEMRILRCTFPEQNAKSKGFMINESLRMASGEWVVLLDADILLGPNMLAELGQVDDQYVWAAPEGRKMLPPDTTAKVLLGDVHPWDRWQELVDGPGEFRYHEGEILPIGFCQCVRRWCMDKVKYNEYEHFEGADWEFMVDIRDQCGEGTWLTTPALHLDHGGSQWYGTQTHR